MDIELARTELGRRRTVDRGEPHGGTPGRTGMRSDALTRILEGAEGSLVASGRVDAALTHLARELVRHPDDGVAVLKRWRKRARRHPDEALTAVATFGEVLKRVVASLQRLPAQFGRVMRQFRRCVAAVAAALGASSYSVTLDLPRSLAVGFTWASPRR